VLTPSLDGCAERKDQVRAGITTETHAAEIADLLFYQDLKDVVLAGTSTGGMVMARAAELARTEWRAWCSPTLWRCSTARPCPTSSSGRPPSTPN
jgi:pimeloyl-ACP methyl ester carboxylesterase